MFHKNALFVNCVLLAFCGTSYYFPELLASVMFSYLILILSSLLPIWMYFTVFLFASFLFVLITSLITRVKIGKSPLGSLIVAYKYGYSDSVSSSTVQSSYEFFPSNDRVQICYERKAGPFGIAYGVVIGDQLTDDVKAILIRHGYNVFKTKPVSNAVYITCPVIPWLSYLGVYLILRVVYPKLYKYSKRHKLSAYPVVEVYRRFSVTLMAPLSQQDIFIVPEAESLMRRSSSRLNLSLNSSVTDLSDRSVSYHSTRSAEKLNFSEIDNNNISKLNPKCSLSPIKNNGATKLPCKLKLSMNPLSNNDIVKLQTKHSSTPIVTNGITLQGEE